MTLRVKYRRYGKYTQTELPWIPSVPSEWEVAPLKVKLARCDGGAWGDDFDDEGTVVLRSTEQTVDGGWRIDAPARRRLTLSAYLATRLKAGDLVMTKSSGSADHIGKTSLVDKHIEALGCSFSNFMQRLRVNRETFPRFCWYALNSPIVRAQFDYLSTTSSGLANLNRETIGGVLLAWPPSSQQEAIAAFLDRETARIDALIEKRRRSIELLHEKRVAAIAHAVMRGLDATVPLKDSGFPWIGQIPRHWEVCRVKMVARLESGHTPSRSVPEYWEDCDIPWVSLNDSKQLARSDYISDTAVQISKRGLDNSSARILPTDAVVFTRDATIGLAAITTRPMAVSQHLIAWIPGPRINSRFLLRVFNAMKPFLDAYTFGATIKTIGMPDVKKLVTPVPPWAEQVAIADALDRTTRCIDQAVDKTQAAMDRLSEYRSAIVSAAVTGQIDVREAA